MSKSSIETTKRNKQAFLDNYPKFLNTRLTTQAINMGLSTHYLWLSSDEEYSRAYRKLKKEIDDHNLELYEAELHSRALGGTSKQSDILLMFGLKALAPGKYREKVADTKVIGDIKIIMAIPGYDESLRLTDGNIIEGEVINGTKQSEE